MTKRAISLRLDGDLIDAADALASALRTDRTDLLARGLRRELLYDGEREFVYALLDDERAVRYVGRSRDPYQRLRAHLAGARAGGGSAKDAWLTALTAEGKVPGLAIIDDAAPEDIAEVEAGWIAHFASAGQITNVRAGVAPRPTGFVTVRIPDDLKDRIDAARPATTSREAWVRDACNLALRRWDDATRDYGARGALEAGQTAAASVGQQVEPGVPLPPAPTASVVPSVLPRTHEPSIPLSGRCEVCKGTNRIELGEVNGTPVWDPCPSMCNTCTTAGPPRTRPCAKCGHKA